MSKLSYMTAEGIKKLREDLEQLKNVERPAISRQIAEARDKGDLSENAEYDAAKEAQGLLEMRIAKLQETLAIARVIDEAKLDKGSVQILSTVRLKNVGINKEMTYTIVSESEANIREGKISINTPIAKGLIGLKVGEKAEIIVPNGKMTFEILEIS